MVEERKEVDPNINEFGFPIDLDYGKFQFIR
jgi:hypothetical protein